jgi:hypothetical protein
MSKIKAKILDSYFKYPFLYDFIFTCLIILFFNVNQNKIQIPFDFNKIDAIISNVVTSLVSLTGFILASLTIIVTVKSNIKIRNLANASNSMELVLSSGNYKKIIVVFRDAIIELVFALILIYILWMPIFSFSKIQYMFIIAFGILVIITTVSRSLAILFKIIFLEFKN